MSRALRIEFPNALYHVMSRGNERQAIVRDDRDRDHRLELLARAVARDGWILHAFALMTNHEHLFIETPRANLSQGLQALNGSYATWFNRRHDRVGHLFQGRPKAHIIEDCGYFCRVSRYIHLNSWRAGLVRRPEHYPWSSYPGYFDRSRTLPFVTYSRVLADFGRTESQARCAYCAFVAEGMRMKLEAPWASAGKDGILGGDRFVDRIRSVLDHVEADPELPTMTETAYRPPLERVILGVRRRLGAEAWEVGRRSDHPGRCIAAYLSREVFGYRSTEIARALGYRRASSVTAAVARARLLPRELQAVMEVLRLELSERPTGPDLR